MAGIITQEPREKLINLQTSFSKQISGIQPEPIKRIREESFKRFLESGIPERKNEDYKYFPVYRHFPEKPYFDFTGKPSAGSELIRKLRIKDNNAIHLFFINGILSIPHSSSDLVQRGIDIVPLENISEENLESYNYLFEQIRNINKDAFIEMNSAFLRRGFILNISRKADNTPVYCYYLNVNSADDQVFNYRYIINLEKNSSATLSEIYYSDSEKKYFENYLTEIYVNAGAKLNYHKIQQTGKNSLHINNTNIYQSENTLSNTYTFTINDHLIRNNLNVLLNEAHCESHLYGLYYVNKNNLFDNHTTVDHNKPDCFSNELYKGIMDDQGKGVFNGKIYVRPNAQKTNAFQSNKNIVLTDSAAVNTKPQLEIWADDVKCSHGATTGQIDKEQLFYLRSRGLDKQTARALLLHAFAFEIVNKVESEPLKEYLTELVNNKLGYQFSD